MLVVPPSEIKNLYSLPDNRLDQSNTTYDSLQINYTVQDLAIIRNDFHLDVVRNQLTRNLDSLTEIMVTEIDNGFRRTFGTCTTTWKELPVWHTCMTLVAGAANGALCGAPLCKSNLVSIALIDALGSFASDIRLMLVLNVGRDEDFLAAMRDHATCVFGGAIVINAVPEIVRPILGAGVKLACSYYYKKALKKCLPVVRDRVELTNRVVSEQASKVELPVCNERVSRAEMGSNVNTRQRLTLCNRKMDYSGSYTKPSRSPTPTSATPSVWPSGSSS